MVKGYLFLEELAFISDRLQAIFKRCANDVAAQISFKDIQEFRKQLCTWNAAFIKPPMSLVSTCRLEIINDFYRRELDLSIFQGFDTTDQELIRTEIAAYAAREVLDAFIGYRLRNWSAIGLESPKWELYQGLVTEYYKQTVSQDRRDCIADIEGALAQATDLTPTEIHVRCVGELFFEVDEIRLMSKVRLDRYLEKVCQQIAGWSDSGGGRYQRLSIPDTLQDSFLFFGLTYPIELNTLRERYRQLALRYHPDKGGSLEMMQRLNIAYRRISDYLRQPATDLVS